MYSSEAITTREWKCKGKKNHHQKEQERETERRNRKQLNKLHKRNLDLDTFVGFISFRFNAFNVALLPCPPAHCKLWCAPTSPSVGCAELCRLYSNSLILQDDGLSSKVVVVVVCSSPKNSRTSKRSLANK